MIDSHCHLNFKSFNDDREAVIKKSFEDGITGIINVGTKEDSSKLAVELAQSHENLYAAVGIHPHHADIYSKENIEEIEKLASKKGVVAIGEIGLDNHLFKGSTKPTQPKDLQIKLLKDLLNLAKNLNLPAIIHCRDAFNELLPIIVESNVSKKGVFHCWSENLENAKKALDIGFNISFTGIITFKDALDIQEVAKAIPLERLLIETDSPFLSPIPLRGLRNVPQNVKIVGEFIAQLRGISTEEVINQTTLNAKKLFSI